MTKSWPGPTCACVSLAVRPRQGAVVDANEPDLPWVRTQLCPVAGATRQDRTATTTAAVATNDRLLLRVTLPPPPLTPEKSTVRRPTNGAMIVLVGLDWALAEDGRGGGGAGEEGPPGGPCWPCCSAVLVSSAPCALLEGLARARVRLLLLVVVWASSSPAAAAAGRHAQRRRIPGRNAPHAVFAALPHCLTPAATSGHDDE